MDSVGEQGVRKIGRSRARWPTLFELQRCLEDGFYIFGEEIEKNLKNHRQVEQLYELSALPQT